MSKTFQRPLYNCVLSTLSDSNAVDVLCVFNHYVSVIKNMQDRLHVVQTFKDVKVCNLVQKVIS
jgi:hypothetical protein